MNGTNTKADLNIISFGYYDFLIGMDWLENHRVILNCYNKVFTCLKEEGNTRTMKGIPRPISIQEISALQLKIRFRKGCHIYVAHMEEPMKDKEPSIKYHIVLKEYEDVFEEFPGLPPKRDIVFSIDSMIEDAPISKTLYRMSTPELKDLQMKL